MSLNPWLDRGAMRGRGASIQEKMELPLPLIDVMKSSTNG